MKSPACLLNTSLDCPTPKVWVCVFVLIVQERPYSTWARVAANQTGTGSLTSPHNICRDVAQVLFDWSIHEVGEGVAQACMELAAHSPLHRCQVLQRVIQDIVLEYIVEVYIVSELEDVTVGVMRVGREGRTKGGVNNDFNVTMDTCSVMQQVK